MTDRPYILIAATKDKDDAHVVACCATIESAKTVAADTHERYGPFLLVEVTGRGQFAWQALYVDHTVRVGPV